MSLPPYSDVGYSVPLTGLHAIPYSYSSSSHGYEDSLRSSDSVDSDMLHNGLLDSVFESTLHKEEGIESVVPDVERSEVWLHSTTVDSDSMVEALSNGRVSRSGSSEEGRRGLEESSFQVLSEEKQHVSTDDTLKGNGQGWRRQLNPLIHPHPEDLQVYMLREEERPMQRTDTVRELVADKEGVNLTEKSRLSTQWEYGSGLFGTRRQDDVNPSTTNSSNQNSHKSHTHTNTVAVSAGSVRPIHIPTNQDSQNGTVEFSEAEDHGDEQEVTLNDSMVQNYTMSANSVEFNNTMDNIQENTETTAHTNNNNSNTNNNTNTNSSNTNNNSTNNTNTAPINLGNTNGTTGNDGGNNNDNNENNDRNWRNIFGDLIPQEHYSQRQYKGFCSWKVLLVIGLGLLISALIMVMIVEAMMLGKITFDNVSVAIEDQCSTDRFVFTVGAVLRNPSMFSLTAENGKIDVAVATATQMYDNEYLGSGRYSIAQMAAKDPMLAILGVFGQEPKATSTEFKTIMRMDVPRIKVNSGTQGVTLMHNAINVEGRRELISVLRQFGSSHAQPAVQVKIKMPVVIELGILYFKMTLTEVLEVEIGSVSDFITPSKDIVDEETDNNGGGGSGGGSGSGHDTVNDPENPAKAQHSLQHVDTDPPTFMDKLLLGFTAADITGMIADVMNTISFNFDKGYVKNKKLYQSGLDAEEDKDKKMMYRAVASGYFMAPPSSVSLSIPGLQIELQRVKLPESIVRKNNKLEATYKNGTMIAKSVYGLTNINTDMNRYDILHSFAEQGLADVLPLASLEVGAFVLGNDFYTPTKIPNKSSPLVKFNGVLGSANTETPSAVSYTPQSSINYGNINRNIQSFSKAEATTFMNNNNIGRTYYYNPQDAKYYRRVDFHAAAMVHEDNQSCWKDVGLDFLNNDGLRVQVTGEKEAKILGKLSNAKGTNGFTSQAESMVGKFVREELFTIKQAKTQHTMMLNGEQDDMKPKVVYTYQSMEDMVGNEFAKTMSTTTSSIGSTSSMAGMFPPLPGSNDDTSLLGTLLRPITAIMGAVEGTAPIIGEPPMKPWKVFAVDTASLPAAFQGTARDSCFLQSILNEVAFSSGVPESSSFDKVLDIEGITVKQINANALNTGLDEENTSKPIPTEETHVPEESNKPVNPLFNSKQVNRIFQAATKAVAQDVFLEDDQLTATKKVLTELLTSRVHKTAATTTSTINNTTTSTTNSDNGNNSSKPTTTGNNGNTSTPSTIIKSNIPAQSILPRNYDGVLQSTLRSLALERPSEPIDQRVRRATEAIPNIQNEYYSSLRFVYMQSTGMLDILEQSFFPASDSGITRQAQLQYLNSISSQFTEPVIRQLVSTVIKVDSPLLPTISLPSQSYHVYNDDKLLGALVIPGLGIDDKPKKTPFHVDVIWNDNLDTSALLVLDLLNDSADNFHIVSSNNEFSLSENIAEVAEMVVTTVFKEAGIQIRKAIEGMKIQNFRDRDGDTTIKDVDVDLPFVIPFPVSIHMQHFDQNVGLPKTGPKVNTFKSEKVQSTFAKHPMSTLEERHAQVDALQTHAREDPEILGKIHTALEKGGYTGTQAHKDVVSKSMKTMQNIVGIRGAVNSVPTNTGSFLGNMGHTVSQGLNTLSSVVSALDGKDKDNVRVHKMNVKNTQSDRSVLGVQYLPYIQAKAAYQSSLQSFDDVDFDIIGIVKNKETLPFVNITGTNLVISDAKDSKMTFLLSVIMSPDVIESVSDVVFGDDLHLYIQGKVTADVIGTVDTNGAVHVAIAGYNYFNDILPMDSMSMRVSVNSISPLFNDCQVDAKQTAIQNTIPLIHSRLLNTSFDLYIYDKTGLPPFIEPLTSPMLISRASILQDNKTLMPSSIHPRYSTRTTLQNKMEMKPMFFDQLVSGFSNLMGGNNSNNSNNNRNARTPGGPITPNIISSSNVTPISSTSSTVRTREASATTPPTAATTSASTNTESNIESLSIASPIPTGGTLPKPGDIFNIINPTIISSPPPNPWWGYEFVRDETTFTEPMTETVTTGISISRFDTCLHMVSSLISGKITADLKNIKTTLMIAKTPQTLEFDANGIVIEF